ncbi:hypothetical protein PEX1_059380 [Penicillium expansum]|uniref:Uncharacterized protein n=1 Tax=Penicillium expansum TaxID=27334 RepID=A0A0A2KRU5_PENEN|nr:hypothetical protein PEX2_089450 [Penicillium expansum]KGO40375.1 hypothetical protein PEXP_031900 [Penicillium expansum]KGO54960.1 hypothetical protein PEX2_089450 [Penicillium expansum]KGO70494.1 hypothetical protein PEX1_059380 [Penicillium expansum]
MRLICLRLHLPQASSKAKEATGFFRSDSLPRKQVEGHGVISTASTGNVFNGCSPDSNSAHQLISISRYP